MEMYKTGVFLCESKNRFLCEVLVDGVIEVCYLSSSSKLKHFIKLDNREVLLICNIGKNAKTKYRLFAARLKSSYILLDLSYINFILYELTEAEMKRKKVEGIILREKKIENVIKADLFFNGNNKIAFEAKGLLDFANEAILPGIRVERAEKQLLGYRKLLDMGIGVRYCIFLLNPNTDSVILNSDFNIFSEAFCDCLLNGMEIRVYKVLWNGGFVAHRVRKIENEFAKSLN